MSTYCNNNEYGCDNKIPDELEGDLCATCEADEKREREYYAALYARERVYTREDVEDAYSHPTERAKQSILIERLGL